jgi:biopolymer transport protein ExbD
MRREQTARGGRGLRLRTTEPTKVNLPMAAMLGVIFQLFVFFMLNLKIVSSEKNYNINMPASGPMAFAAQRTTPEIKVRLQSDRDGNLRSLSLGTKDLGNDDAAFERLNREILALIGRPGGPVAHDVEVEIDADFETQYKYVVQAISKCTGRFDPESRQAARYVEKIKFSQPHKPKV